MISIPTLIHSVIDYKTNMSDMRNNTKNSIDYLIKCIRSINKYINKNLDSLPQRYLFNMTSLDNLNQLAKKAHSRRTSQTDHLIQEQTDRIFSVLMDSLYQSYEKVFKALYTEIMENHYRPFLKLEERFNLIENFIQLDNCRDFISLKYLNNISLLENLQALKVYSNLMAFIYVERVENYYFEDHKEIIDENIDNLYRNFIFNAYKEAISLNRNFIQWSDEQYFYIYVCWTESLMVCG